MSFRIVFIILLKAKCQLPSQGKRSRKHSYNISKLLLKINSSLLLLYVTTRYFTLRYVTLLILSYFTFTFILHCLFFLVFTSLPLLALHPLPFLALPYASSCLVLLFLTLIKIASSRLKHRQ